MTIAVRRLQRWLLLIPGLIPIGCSSDDQRLVDVSRQSLDRQAEQNRLVRRTTNKSSMPRASWSKPMLRPAARTSSCSTGSSPNARASISSGITWSRSAAKSPNSGTAIRSSPNQSIGGGPDRGRFPLVVCLFVLRGLFHKSDDEAMADVLVEELLLHNAIAAGLDHPRMPAKSPSQLLEVPRASRQAGSRSSRSRLNPAGVLVVVEGLNDIEFLRRISRMLHRHDLAVPDLDRLEADGRLTFLTAGASACFQSRIVAAKNSISTTGKCLPMTDERHRLVEVC